MSIKKIDNYRIRLNEILGVNGNTYMGFNNITKQQVVIKVIPKISLNEKYLSDIPKFKQQVRFLHKIRKNVSYVVRYLNLLQTVNHFYLIMEYCKSGNLKKILLQKKITYLEAFKYMRHILKGFIELIKKGILHGNLAPNNILFHNGLMRLADFGLSYRCQVENIYSQIKNTTYLPPQVLQGRPYNYKSDIWSLGIIFYQMLYGIVPWKTGKVVKIYLERIQSQPLQFPNEPQIPQSLKILIRGCLQKNEKNRIQWQEIFSNQVFNGQFSQMMSTDVRVSYMFGGLRCSLFEYNLDLQRYFQSQNIKSQSVLNYQIFKKLLLSIDPYYLQEDIQYLFNLFDSNNNKYIQYSQFHNALQHFEINMQFQPFRRKNKKKSQVSFENKILTKDQLFQLVIQKLVQQIKIKKIYDLYQFFIRQSQGEESQNVSERFKMFQNGIDYEMMKFLLNKIQSKLNDQQCKCLYMKINHNSNENIQFQIFMKQICTFTGLPFKPYIN